MDLHPHLLDLPYNAPEAACLPLPWHGADADALDAISAAGLPVADVLESLPHHAGSPRGRITAAVSGARGRMAPADALAVLDRWQPLPPGTRPLTYTESMRALRRAEQARTGMLGY